MRRSLWLSVVAGLAVLSGCADTAGLPDGTRAGPQVIASVSGGSAGCTLSNDVAGVIDAALQELYIKNLWPDANSVKGKFQAVKTALAAGDVVAARAAVVDLIGFIENKFGKLTAAEKAAVQALVDQVITDLNCFVGIYDLNPGDPETAFQIPGVGGVNFPANVVATGTRVIISETDGQICPLNTDLDCFSSFLSIELVPAAVLPQPAVVVLCPPNLISTLAVAHQDQSGFEILTPTTNLGLLQTGLVCPQPLSQTSGSRNWLTRVANFLSPERLEAAPMMFLGGIGGLTTKFSPFGLVNTTIIGTGGLGGKTTSFTPPAAAAPNAAPPVNPDLPASYLQGNAGTTTETGLPFVTIKTPGGDVDGVNPIAGITVTFRTGPATAYELDSDAKVCAAGGGVPASGAVQVVTDANGVATLPCLAFGIKAGFANLSATFDPATLNFPNANLVTITAIEGTSSGNSLNWLVKSNSLPASALSFVTAPSGSAGAGVPLAQQPKIQLLDALGNEVYTGAITVTASVTAGGGTANYTGPVTTDADGVATFTDLSIGGPAGPQTLTFTLGSGTVLDQVVQLGAGPASQLAITTAPPVSVGAGVAFGAPAVTIQDQFGNTTASTATVTAHLKSGTGGTLAGTTSVDAVAGVATFADLKINGTAGDFTLEFKSGALTSAASTTIAVGAGPAAKLVITTQPSSTAAAGVAFAAQPVVVIQDQFDNQVPSPAAVVASLASGTGGTLVGTTSVNASGGTASFSGLRIDGTAGNFTLQFTSGALTSSASGAIAVGAGPAAKLVITTQPSSTAVAGVAFAAQPVVAIRDQFDNLTNSGAAVIASLASGVGTLTGSLSATASGGVATFAGLRIDGVVGDRTLKFTSGGIDSPASGTVAITAGAAASIMTFISGTAAQSYNYGAALTAYTNVSPVPQVIVKDAWGNPVGGQPVSWTAVTSNGAVLTVGGAGTPTTAAGTAEVTSWLIGDGLNQATASLSLAGLLDAQFTATTPTGVSVFACAAGTGGSKTDLGGLSIKAPNGTIKKVTLWMSITGAASGLSNYGATFEAYLNSPIPANLLKSTSGNVSLPGDNGNAVPVTFTFPTSIAKQSASSVIWFKLTVAAPSTRKPQVWYSSATFKSPATCFESKAYAPGSTTTFKRGLSINVTN